jgi:hypothetical protein
LSPQKYHRFIDFHNKLLFAGINILKEREGGVSNNILSNKGLKD